MEYTVNGGHGSREGRLPSAQQTVPDRELIDGHGRVYIQCSWQAGDGSMAQGIATRRPIGSIVRSEARSVGVVES